MSPIIESKHWGEVAVMLIKDIRDIILEITFTVFWKRITLGIFKRSMISDR